MDCGRNVFEFLALSQSLTSEIVVFGGNEEPEWNNHSSFPHWYLKDQMGYCVPKWNCCTNTFFLKSTASHFYHLLLHSHWSDLTWPIFIWFMLIFTSNMVFFKGGNKNVHVLLFQMNFLWNSDRWIMTLVANSCIYVIGGKCYSYNPWNCEAILVHKSRQEENCSTSKNSDLYMRKQCTIYIYFLFLLKTWHNYSTIYWFSTL